MSNSIAMSGSGRSYLPGQGSGHTIAQGAALDPGPQVVDEDLGDTREVAGGMAGCMRRQDDIGQSPQRGGGIQRFMGKDIDEFHKERGQAKRFETFSMEVVNDEVMSMPGDSSMQPEVIVEEAEFMEAVVQAIDELPERERLVMSLYYVEELNLKEIGEVLGVSESRVSQILSAVVKKLRQNLQIS
jgi:RNA polymerase sigma factor (sigma-70 family)